MSFEKSALARIAISMSLCCMLLAACSETKVRNADGSSEPRTSILGTVSTRDHFLSLPTDQRRRAIAVAVLARYEIHQTKSIQRVLSTPFKTSFIGPGESACMRVEYSDPKTATNNLDLLIVSLGDSGLSQPIRILDVTRGINIGNCTSDPHSEFPELQQVKDAMAQNRNPITLMPLPKQTTQLLNDAKSA